MPGNGTTPRAPDPLLTMSFRPRTSIRARIFRQTVLIETFSILLLGGLSFFVSTTVLTAMQLDPGRLLIDPQNVGFTILGLTGLLVLFGFLLSVLLSRQISAGIHELARKAHAIRTDQWAFPETIKSGDEIESLDHIVAHLAERLRLAYRSLEHRMLVTAEGLRRETAIDATILESIEYGVLVVDTQGTISESNPSAARLLGIAREQLMGAPLVHTLPLLARHAELKDDEHPVTHALRGEHYHSHPIDHLRLVRKDQTFLPISLVAAPLTSNGERFGAIIVFQDMTEERQIDYMKSEFISLASHQLRTPLSSIRWYAELLSSADSKTMSDDQKAYITEIAASSQRMANLIEALLHVARIESGVLVPEKQTVDLADFVRNMSKEWGLMAQEKGIALETHIGDGGFSLSTDPVLLQIAVQNVLSNALKYSLKGGSVTLSLARRNQSVEFTVTDTGIGIQEKDAERLFQKFFRGHNARTMDTDGNGLGLYISRAVMTALGGSITFSSEAGKGTTFCITLTA